MAAPLPSSRLSPPTAGLFNALLHVLNRGLDLYVAELEDLLADAQQLNAQLNKQKQEAP